MLLPEALKRPIWMQVFELLMLNLKLNYNTRMKKLMNKWRITFNLVFYKSANTVIANYWSKKNWLCRVVRAESANMV